MSEEVIRYRAPEEYLLACRQCENEVIYGYNKRFNTILERHRRYFKDMSGCTLADTRMCPGRREDVPSVRPELVGSVPN